MGVGGGGGECVCKKTRGCWRATGDLCVGEQEFMCARLGGGDL